MHRLQPVAHIRQRARHDRRQRIGQIALAERVGEVDVADSPSAVSVIVIRPRCGQAPIIPARVAAHALGETGARLRQPPALRLQQVVEQEMAGESEAGDDIAAGGRGVAPQKTRQRQQLVVVGRAGRARHRTARARRNVGEVVVDPGRGAAP